MFVGFNVFVVGCWLSIACLCLMRCFVLFGVCWVLRVACGALSIVVVCCLSCACSLYDVCCLLLFDG